MPDVPPPDLHVPVPAAARRAGRHRAAPAPEHQPATSTGTAGRHRAQATPDDDNTASMPGDAVITHEFGLDVKIWTVSIPSVAAASAALYSPPETDR